MELNSVSAKVLNTKPYNKPMGIKLVFVKISLIDALVSDQYILYDDISGQNIAKFYLISSFNILGTNFQF